MKSAIVILLSVLCAAFAEPPAVPAVRVIPKVAFTLADFVAQTPQSAKGDFLMEVPQLVNLSLSEEARGVLNGKSVEMVGQFTSIGGRLRLMRSLMSCCAVHARAYEVDIQFDAPKASLVEMGWVKITGAVIFREENGKLMPVVVAKDVLRTVPPQNPLLR